MAGRLGVGGPPNFWPARAVGLESQDYLNDKVPEDPDDGSCRRILLTGYELQRFASEGELRFETGPADPLTLNEYVLLVSPEGKTMPARCNGAGTVRRLRLPEFVRAPGGIPIRARNLEQQFLMAALLDEGISLITCFGKAGTGKTLLSTACALHQTCDDHSRYDGVAISRPVIALGKDIITRISEGSKIVLIGDPAQIDNPYVDARSNGLVYCRNRMRGQPIAAHIKLVKGERSRLAELAADLL
jgi:predicted ribonuclease YlaK